MSLVEQAVELAPQGGARIVLVQAHLLEDHVALARQLGRIEDRVEHHVGEQGDPGHRAGRGQEQVVEGVVVGGAGVGAPAHRLDVALDESARPRLGSLEEHVLGEVREAPLADRFVAPAHAGPQMNRHGGGGSMLLDDEPHAVGEHFADGRGQPARSRRGRGVVTHPPGVYRRKAIAQTRTAHLPMEGVIAATRYQSPRQFAGSSVEGMPGRTPSWAGARLESMGQ